VHEVARITEVASFLGVPRMARLVALMRSTAVLLHRAIASDAFAVGTSSLAARILLRLLLLLLLTAAHMLLGLIAVVHARVVSTAVLAAVQELALVTILAEALVEIGAGYGAVARRLGTQARWSRCGRRRRRHVAQLHGGCGGSCGDGTVDARITVEAVSVHLVDHHCSEMRVRPHVRELHAKQLQHVFIVNAPLSVVGVRLLVGEVQGLRRRQVQRLRDFVLQRRIRVRVRESHLAHGLGCFRSIQNDDEDDRRRMHVGNTCTCSRRDVRRLTGSSVLRRSVHIMFLHVLRRGRRSRRRRRSRGRRRGRRRGRGRRHSTSDTLQHKMDKKTVQGRE
jgi:hypothetical protein